jgi:hypothetical protein
MERRLSLLRKNSVSPESSDGDGLRDLTFDLAGFFKEFCVCRFASAHWANFRDFLLLAETGKRKCVKSEFWYKMDNIGQRMSRKQDSISI